MNEKFLSIIWKYRLYTVDILTTDGIPIKVKHTGSEQFNAGPDFFNAQIQIGETLWVGNVELHVKSSDWYRHKHDTDKSYNNVILHVVYEADTDIILPGLTTVPTLELQDFICADTIKSYLNLQQSNFGIPCGNNLHTIEPTLFLNWTERMLVERLEHKSLLIELSLIATRNDWEEAFYLLMARSFGFNVNAGPFEMVTRCLPRKLLLKYKGQLQSIEALLYGQSGLLSQHFNDGYANSLKQEYGFLSVKYGLIPIERHLWKFLRMRPANFPTIRMAQFAALMNKGGLTFSQLLEINELDEIAKFLKVTVSPYWQNHYMFDKITSYSNRTLGESSINNLLINTIIPCLFYYGKSRSNDKLVQKAFNWLKNIPAEENKVTKIWKKNKINVLNAYDSQAYLNLYQSFCSKKKCLNCSLGISILRKNE